MPVSRYYLSHRASVICLTDNSGLCVVPRYAFFLELRRREEAPSTFRVAAPRFSGTVHAWDGTIRLWDVTGSAEAREIHTNARVRSVAYSPEGQWLASSGDDGARIWNLETGSWPHIERTFPSEAAFVLRADRIYSADLSGALRVRNMKSEMPLCTLSGHTDQLNSLAVSEDGSVLVSAGDDGTIKVWRVNL
jgi:WD40 repeat protein